LISASLQAATNLRIEADSNGGSAGGIRQTAGTISAANLLLRSGGSGLGGIADVDLGNTGTLTVNTLELAFTTVGLSAVITNSKGLILQDQGAMFGADLGVGTNSVLAAGNAVTIVNNGNNATFVDHLTVNGAITADTLILRSDDNIDINANI